MRKLIIGAIAVMVLASAGTALAETYTAPGQPNDICNRYTNHSGWIPASYDYGRGEEYSDGRLIDTFEIPGGTNAGPPSNGGRWDYVWKCRYAVTTTTTSTTTTTTQPPTTTTSSTTTSSTTTTTSSTTTTTSTTSTLPPTTTTAPTTTTSSSTTTTDPTTTTTKPATTTSNPTTTSVVVTTTVPQPTTTVTVPTTLPNTGPPVNMDLGWLALFGLALIVLAGAALVAVGRRDS